MNNWRNWALAILGPVVITIISSMACDNGSMRTFVVAIACMFLHVYLGTSWITRKIAWAAYFACWIIIASPLFQMAVDKHGKTFPMTKAFSVRSWKGFDLFQARLANVPLVEMDMRIEDQLKNEEQALTYRTYSSAAHMARVRREFDEYSAKVRADIEARASDKKKVEAKNTPAPAPAPAPVVQPAPITTTSSAPTSGKLLSFTIPPHQLYTIDRVKGGQEWRWQNIAGTFSQRVDTGNRSACWKQITKPSRWRADVDGTLEIKAGDTPVYGEVHII